MGPLAFIFGDDFSLFILRYWGRPHPRGQGGGPLAFILGDNFSLFIYFKIFRGVSGLLELRRIGLQYLLLFQPRIPAAGILPLHVNLVK